MNVSGNIADMIAAKKNGTIVASTEELINYFINSDRIKQAVCDFETRCPEFPKELVQNEQILELVCGTQEDEAETKLHLVGRRWIYEAAYRFINRKKLRRRERGKASGQNR